MDAYYSLVSASHPNNFVSHPNIASYPNMLLPQPLPNLLYKTEFCRNIDESGCCRYGDKCQFAHSVLELRPKITHHPHYRTELCTSFHTTGICNFGRRCAFIHTRNWQADWRVNKMVIYVHPWMNQFHGQREFEWYESYQREVRRGSGNYQWNRENARQRIGDNARGSGTQRRYCLPHSTAGDYRRG